MKNKYFILVLLVLIPTVLIPFIYWAKNPEFTQMQVMLKTWWVIIPIILIGITIRITKVFEK